MQQQQRRQQKPEVLQSTSTSLRYSTIEVEHGGDQRRAFVLGEDHECVYVRLWNNKDKAWESSGPKNGHRVDRGNIVSVVYKRK